MHQLWEQRLSALQGDSRDPYPPSESEAIELECNAAFAAYCAHYPLEPFDVVAVEQVFEVAIPGTEHTYTGKFDGIIRYKEAPYEGQLSILEHKTEARSSTRNLPEAWAARSQVSLYMWAAEKLFQERPVHILLDVLRRASTKGQEPATFYRDILERTVEQSESAVADLVYVADQIGQLNFKGARYPQNTDNCMNGRFKCDFYNRHILQIDSDYQEAEDYLSSL